MTTVPESNSLPLSRRDMLCRSGLGFGTLAVTHLLQREVKATQSDAALDVRTHFPPRARSMIMLMQNGGPSQMDLFDPKPDLTARHGQTYSERVEMFQQGSEKNQLLASPLEFAQHGQSGMPMATVLPHLGSVADELCMVRSMFNAHNNHTESLVAINTGKIFSGRPALGSWITYALGSENQNLPAYLVLRDPEGYNTSGTLLWQNGWLPARFRGTEINTQGTPLLHLAPNQAVDAELRTRGLKLMGSLNREHQRQYPLNTELEARIQNYELAARMQLVASDLLDLSKETQATRDLYGLDDPETAGYGMRCLMARRLVEIGVRFVQVFPPVKPQFQPWDAHTNVKDENVAICRKCDRPSAALIQDLKQRGLLDETIVLWTGEFGRLPVSQNGRGRDHNRNAFTLLLAGGGFKPGHIHGATDDVGYRAVEDRVSVPDLHATLLHQLGLDHDRLVFHRHGSDETLTDSRVSNARVVSELLSS